MPMLTEEMISALQVPTGKREAWLSDDKVQGLRLRATAGAKTFYACWTDRATRDRRREKLGAWGGITLAQARNAARVRLGQIASGVDPRKVRQEQRAAAAAEAVEARLTLAKLIEEWGALHLSKRRPRYAAEAQRALRYALAGLLHRPASRVTKAEAVNVLDAMEKAGKAAMASRTLAYARACYRWAERRGKVPNNPFAGIPLEGGTADRDRALSDEEVGAVWRACGELGWPFGPLFRVALLTGQRREEVAAMRWSELSADMAMWTIPNQRTKNGLAHVVHLASETREALASVPRREERPGAEADLVFSTTGKTPVSGFSRAMARLNALIEGERARAAAEAGRRAPAPMPSWRLHDFRRTIVTQLAGMGFAPHVADKLLNHVTTTGLSDVARVYQRNQFLPERKAALEAWAEHVLACGTGSATSGNVVPFRPALAAG